jgi:diacylglycerol O-acyltransferase
MVRALSTLDAGFLQMEDADPRVSLAIGGVAVLDGPPPDFDELVSTIGERCLADDRTTLVLHRHPLDLAAPEWVKDPEFDLNHHVRRAALTGDGDDDALYAEIAAIMERRLDRQRPLWECWFIEGLAGDRWALLVKVHHALADGIAATTLLSSLADDPDVASFAADIAGSRGAPPVRGRLTLNPVALAGDSVRAAVGIARAAVRIAAGAAEVATGILRPAAQSPLTGPVSDMRRYSATTVARRDIEVVCDAFGVTLNDVALAAVADSYRAALMRRGKTPRPDSLRTLVPVSVRAAPRADRPDEEANRVSLMLPYLPVDVADPLTRLQTMHERMSAAKSSGQRQAGGALVWTTTRLIPFPVTAWAVRLLSRLPQRGVVTVATNVPGPRGRLRVMGREVVRLLPIAPIALQVRTAVAMLSYADELTFGLTVDFDAGADVGELADGIGDGVRRLVTLAAATKR